MSDYLIWPHEPELNQEVPEWYHQGSNICLDFHGDPANSQLVIFSDGNHHMALAGAVTEFQMRNSGLEGIFYATTPPGVLVDTVKDGRLHLGNLRLSIQPHVFISPEPIMKRLLSLGVISSCQEFMQSRGNVLLVRKNNPENIQDIRDLLRTDVRLFISNPETEAASYNVYKNTLLAVAGEQGLSSNDINACLDPELSNIVYGRKIHHREAPQAIYEENADAAIVYYHLALRYTRIFPEAFEFVSLTGAGHDPATEAGNEKTTYYIAKMNEPGMYGQQFIDFCMSDKVAAIYALHGLQQPE